MRPLLVNQGGSYKDPYHRGSKGYFGCCCHDQGDPRTGPHLGCLPEVSLRHVFPTKRSNEGPNDESWQEEEHPDDRTYQSPDYRQPTRPDTSSTEGCSQKIDNH